MFESDFQEGVERCAKLEEVPTEVFEGFLQWLYFGVGALSRCMTSESNTESLRRSIAVYIFAEQQCIKALQNVLIDQIYKVLFDKADQVTIDNIDEVYTLTIPTSPLRKLLVNWMINQSSEDLIEYFEARQDGTGVPTEFAIDIVLAQNKKGFSYAITPADRSSFYV